MLQKKPIMAAVALALSLLCLGSSRSVAATFTATLDRETGTVGESVILTLQFEGGEPKAIPSPPSMPNVQIADQGSSRQINIVNSQVSANVSETFALTPTQPGEFTVPALKAEVGGQVLTSAPLKFKA